MMARSDVFLFCTPHSLNPWVSPPAMVICLDLLVSPVLAPLMEMRLFTGFLSGVSRVNPILGLTSPKASSEVFGLSISILGLARFLFTPFSVLELGLSSGKKCIPEGSGKVIVLANDCGDPKKRWGEAGKLGGRGESKGDLS